MSWEPLLLQVVLIALNAIFASAEIAVISTNETKLKKMAQDGDKRAGRLVNLTEQPARFLATIQVAITLAGMLSSAFAAESFAGPLAAALAATGIGIPENVLKSVCLLVITVVLAYFNLVFGELVPKRVAMKKSESLALGLSGLLAAVYKISAPLVWLLTVSTNGILRLVGIDPNDNGEEVSEEEIRMMLEAGNEKGTFDEEEVEMIQNVFAFDDTSVEEVCTHRVDVVMLDMDDDMTVWEETIQNSRFTYYPISGEDDDDIIGVLDTKDFFRLADRSRESVMANAVDKPYFVPETVKADVLLTNMKRERKYFAILLDEYGGLSGIITLRDIMQLLVGDFYEEEEEVEEAEIVRTGDMEWKVAGSADLEEVAEALAVTLPVEEYETFGGYICGVLVHVPDDGTSFLVDTEEIQIQVHNVDNHRILGTTVLVKPKKEENTETE